MVAGQQLALAIRMGPSIGLHLLCARDRSNTFTIDLARNSNLQVGSLQSFRWPASGYRVRARYLHLKRLLGKRESARGHHYCGAVGNEE